MTSGQSHNRPTLYRDLDIIDDDYSPTLPASEGGLGIPTLQVALNDMALLGGLGPLSDQLAALNVPMLLNWVINLLLDRLVNPLVGTVDTWLLSPLLEALGASRAGGTIQAVPPTECGTPRLVE